MKHGRTLILVRKDELASSLMRMVAEGRVTQHQTVDVEVLRSLRGSLGVDGRACFLVVEEAVMPEVEEIVM
jgi:hypothetical protein